MYSHYRENLENIGKKKEKKAMNCLILIIILPQIKPKMKVNFVEFGMKGRESQKK